MRPILVAALFVILASAAVAQTAAPAAVDLELVLAVDISNSMDPDEQALQRQGYIAAITSKEVMDGIRNGPLGRIAVTYVEWAGAAQQTQLVAWHVIDGPDSAEAFAARLSEAPLSRYRWTSISGALIFSAELFDKNPYRGERQVIDVSGDGANNNGAPVVGARDALLAKGIVINGLPIMLKRPYSSFDIANLDEYYKTCVIGGPGSFMIPVRDKATFIEAIRTKLIMEVAGLTPEAKVIPVQAAAPVSCGFGDNLWRNPYFGGYDRN